MASLQQTVSRIKSLEIQGASRIRKAAVAALRGAIGKSKAKTQAALRREIRSAAGKLVKARPTEPGLRTAMRIILQESHSPFRDAAEMKACLDAFIGAFELGRERALQAIAANGVRVFPRKKATVFTHCHSHTVEAILLRAWREKRLKKVYCTETRPNYQGRITAAALAKAGVPVTLLVDSAAATVLGECDLFLSGADAVLGNGNVVNKIGTRLLSMAARDFGVPHYVAASTHKFDALTLFGFEETIERRPAGEVWERPPARVRVENAAFDATEARFVKGIITEDGCFAPRALVKHLVEKWDVDREKAEYLSLLKLLK